jgi:inner membrane protein
MSSGSLQQRERFTRSPAFKLVLIGVIIFILTIPQLMVWTLVEERAGRAESARIEVAGSWGRDQQLRGPYLIIPYVERVTDTVDGKPVVREVERQAAFLPAQLDISGKVRSKRLHRSIYDITVYNAELALSGRFAPPDFQLIAPNVASVRWKDAILVVGLTNLSGIKQSASLLIDGNRHLSFEPSLGAAGNELTGIHARLYATNAKVDSQPAFTFATTLGFAGSGSLRFAPAGRETNVKLDSDWPHPSFQGAFLPDNRDVSATGFAADWHVPHLARSVPQSWVTNVYSNVYGAPGQPLDQFGSSLFGVDFFIPLDYYDLVNRGLKYGLIFLVTAFGAVFVIELLSGRRVHGVQYLLVGVAMVFFYVLLLSLAEHIGFTPAYLVSAAATGGMLALYVGKILGSRQQGYVMLAVFLVIYGFLYMILRLEDYALLAGALLGFALLTALMFLTLRVDWSGGRGGSAEKAQEG